MEAIFDEKTIELLLEFNVSEQEIARIQFEKLKEHCIEILSEIIELFKTDNFPQVKHYLTFSGAGDGYGSDNYYIDFGYIFKKDGCVDISEACDYLLKLKYGEK